MLDKLLSIWYNGTILKGVFLLGKFIDLTGQKFGKLTVIKRSGSDNHGATWLCLCECGNSIIVSSGNLKSGNTKSCGCLRQEAGIKNGIANRQYKKEDKRLLSIWRSIHNRCETETYISYKYYGKRGIRVCKEWSEFENFERWAKSNGYEENLTIDRIDINGDYCPQNCRWVNMKTQANNKSNNKYIEYQGRIQTLAQWCDELELNYARTQLRLSKYYWTVEDAFRKEKYVRKTK